MLSQEGIFAGILMMPVLPFIEDAEDNVQSIVELAHENGARFIYPAFGVTLRQNQREWYFNKLDQLFPGLKEKYIVAFGNSYECRSPRSDELWQCFRSSCDQYGILYRMEDIIRGYKEVYRTSQLSFF
jgi:DNA repair photolyase